MKPIKEREAQYLWSIKSKRYKKRYLEALVGLYQDSSKNDPDKTQDYIVAKQSQPIPVG